MHANGPTPRSVVVLGTFLTLWLGAVTGTPVLFILALLGNKSALIIICAFLAMRLLMPIKRSRVAQQTMALGPRPYNRPVRVRYTSDDPCPHAERDTYTFYGVHPHGVLSIGWSHACTLPEFYSTDTQFLASKMLLQLPLVGEFLRVSGILPNDKHTFNTLMDKGENLAILVGGFEEAALYKRHAFRVFVRHRKGFVKYLLQHGYAARPVFVFGEEKTYWASQALQKLRLWLASKGIPGVIFVGFAHMPDFRYPLGIAIGKRVQMPKIEQPTSDDVDKYHADYLAALQEAFDHNKDELALERQPKLEIY